MSCIPETTKADGDSVKIGSTGTVGSLISLEFESMKNAPQTASFFQKKNVTKTTHRRKTPSSEPSSNKNTVADHGIVGQNIKQKPSRNSQRAPILSCEANSDKHASKAKRHTYMVEVVDIKCNNPMSNSLKKLGFSKLSEAQVFNLLGNEESDGSAGSNLGQRGGVRSHCSVVVGGHVFSGKVVLYVEVLRRGMRDDLLVRFASEK